MKQRCLNFSGTWNCSYKPTSELLMGTMKVLLAWMLLAKANPQTCKGNGGKGYLPLAALMGLVETLLLWTLIVAGLANAQSTGRATLTGGATDPNAAVIIGPTITLT